MVAATTPRSVAAAASVAEVLRFAHCVWSPHLSPSSGAGPSRSGAWIYVLLAGVAALGAVALLAVVFPQAIAVAVGVFALVALHYAVWGWWLGPLLREQVEAETASKEALARQKTPIERNRDG